MKKHFIPFLALLVSLSAFSQLNNAGFSARNVSFESNLRHQQLVRDIENIMIDSRHYTLKDINGTPYNNEQFTVGEVFLGNESIGKYFLRYDIYNEELQTKQDENTVTAFTKARSLNAQIGNNLLVYKDYTLDDEKKEGYFYVLSSGKNSKLLLKKLKVFKEGIKAQSSFQKDVSPRFVDKEYYFLEKDDKLINIKKFNNKVILKLLENNSDVSEFMKKNKINVKKQMDLIKVLDYYNTLKI